MIGNRNRDLPIRLRLAEMLTHLAIVVAISNRAYDFAIVIAIFRCNCDWPKCLRIRQSSSQSAIVLAIGNRNRDLPIRLRLAEMLAHSAIIKCQEGFESLSLCRHKTKGHPLRREAAARKTYGPAPRAVTIRGHFPTDGKSIRGRQKAREIADFHIQFSTFPLLAHTRPRQ